MKVLISPSSFGACGDEPLRMLEENAIQAIINPYGRKLTEEEVVTLGRECEGILAGVEPLSAKVFDELPKLRCISRVGAGMQSVDLEAAEARGIVVWNTPEGPTQPVAELAVGLAFALLRHIPQAHQNLREGVWKKEMGSLVTDKRVGIIGLGRIGRRSAELFLKLGCDVIAVDPAPDLEWLEHNSVRMVSLQELLGMSDIVVLHLSVDVGSPPIISETELRQMKKGAYLLNLARGEAIDEIALFNALTDGTIAGAALDVFSEEPYEGDLRTLENVVLTPHLGSYAREARLKMEVDAVENLLKELKGWSSGVEVN
ncbi:MAG: hydroxyacid dehydrogenase [Anaerolineales bacterium]|nr:hydroxyacid dehydrogenase [Anaerolineales bacterium]